MSQPASPHQPLAILYTQHRGRLVRRAARSFPRVCPSQAEDAVQDLFLGILRRQARGELPNLPTGAELVPYVWRAMRQRWRTRVRHPEHGVALEGLLDPKLGHGESALEARRAVEALDHLLLRAARRFGPVEPMLAALRARMADEDTETALARRFGVRRESLNRAVAWMAEELGLKARAAPRSRCTPRQRT